MTQPTGAQKIENIDDFLAGARHFTHVAVFRSKLEYYHHYLVLDVGCDFVDILHYAAGKDAMQARAVAQVTIQRIPLDSDLLDFSSGIYFIKKQNYPSTDDEKRLVCERIFTRLGETEYSASSNNCESLVTWILTGEASSEQFEKGSAWKRMFGDFIGSGLDQVSKVFHRLSDIPTKLSSMSISFNNLFCFLLAALLNTLKRAKTVFTVGSRATAAGVSTGVTAFVATPVEAAFCAKEIHALYRKGLKSHINETNFIREVTKKIGGSASSVVTATYGELFGAFFGQLVCSIPVLGGLVGGFIGGVVGSFTGRALGTVVFGKLYDAVKSFLVFLKNSVTSYLDNAWDGFKKSMSKGVLLKNK